MSDASRRPASQPSASDGRESLGSRPVTRVYFACVNRYLTVMEGRSRGAIARCPSCGKSMTLPPRGTGDGDGARFFQVGC